jgi:predicted permease
MGRKRQQSPGQILFVDEGRPQANGARSRQLGTAFRRDLGHCTGLKLPMRWFRILRLRIRSLFDRTAMERELEEELGLHFDLQVEQNIAAGMDPIEARYAALREFGPVTLHKDHCRDARRTGMIEGFWEDARYAVRNLRRDPFLALAATVTLAVCIGANTTVFSVANSILIRPLPYPHSYRIDWISERSGPARQDVGAAPDYFALREQNRIFEDVGAFDSMTVTWTGVERPEQLDAADVSPSFFRVLGSQPMLGRYLAPEEEGPKAPLVAVLSYAFWRNRMGGDAHIVGKTIALDRLPRTIVGVMPQGFDFPRGTQLWVPSVLDKATDGFPISPTRGIFETLIVARRKPHVTPQETATEMDRLTLFIRAEYPREFRQTAFRTDLTIAALPLQEHLTGPVRPALLILAGTVGLVLLIACANLANLLLARAGSRRRELAVRLALGSGRGRIIRQMLTETLVLAVPGGLAGIGLAWLAVHVFDATKPAILARYPAISMDWRVLAFTITLTLATSLLFGVVPAVSAAGIHIQEALKSAGLAHSSTRGAAWLRKILVVAEISVSLVLLIGAGLLVRSFVHLAHIELGFPSDHLLSFRLRPIGPFDRDYTPFYAEVLDRLKQSPVVRTATLTTDIPLSDEDFFQTGRIRVLGRPSVAFAERPIILNTEVSPEFFHTLEIPLKGGRIFDGHDFVRSPVPAYHGFIPSEPVVVNEALVRRIFPGEDPLGKRIGFGPDQINVTWSIVGVVGDIRGAALGADSPAIIYRCTCSGDPVFRAAFIVRTDGDPQAAIRAIEQQVRAVDRDQPIYDVKAMDQRKDAALAPERFQVILLGSFALIAILLAVAGVYGTMSYLVTRRTREIGIRMAMGARQADVVRMVMGETTVLVLLAIAVGLGGAWAVTRYIRSMLYGVSELDPTTFTLTSILLAVVVFVASVGPARRAVLVDPMSALQDE